MSEHNQETSATFLCTRPRLATELTTAGYEPRLAEHPFKPGMAAWIFPLTEDTKRIARGFYNGIGAKLPNALQEGGDRK